MKNLIHNLHTHYIDHGVAYSRTPYYYSLRSSDLKYAVACKSKFVNDSELGDVYVEYYRIALIEEIQDRKKFLILTAEDFLDSFGHSAAKGLYLDQERIAGKQFIRYNKILFKCNSVAYSLKFSTDIHISIAYKKNTVLYRIGADSEFSASDILNVHLGSLFGTSDKDLMKYCKYVSNNVLSKSWDINVLGMFFNLKLFEPLEFKPATNNGDYSKSLILLDYTSEDFEVEFV
jgi:hypothetical protein